MGKQDILTKVDERRGLEYILTKTRFLNDVKELSFPDRSTDTWMGFEAEEVLGKNIQEFQN